MRPAQSIQAFKQFQVRVLTDVRELALAEELVQSAYLDSGKTAAWKADSTPRASDQDNRRIRVLGMFSGSRCVGSAVLHFPESPRHGSDLPFAFLPETVQKEGIARGILPRPEECVEVSRLAIDKAFRGSGALKVIFQSLHRELRLSGRSKLLISSDQRLLAKYRSVTFHPIGLTYSKQQQDHADRITVMVSKQKHFGSYAVAVDPIRWCLFVKEPVENLRNEGLLKLSALERIVYPTYSLFEPLAKVISEAVLARETARFSFRKAQSKS